MAESGQEQQKRQIAYKSCIADVLKARYFKTENSNPNYLEIAGREVYRVNIIATVVGKAVFNSYTNFLIDDGTEKISARAFESADKIDMINIGEVAQIIGRPREFSSEKYVLIEIMKPINPKWALARIMELELKDGLEKTREKDVILEEVYGDNPAGIIVKMIRELDKGDGVSIEELASKNIKEVDKMVNMLLKGGDLFEIRPGKLKVLE